MHADNTYLFRMIAPSFPAFNVYSRIASTTTALGPVSVATKINEMEEWDVEIIDENNYHKPAPRNPQGLPDHNILQTVRPADIVGLYGGLSSTIPSIETTTMKLLSETISRVLFSPCKIT